MKAPVRYPPHTRPYNKVKLLRILNRCGSYGEVIRFKAAYRTIYRDLPADAHHLISECFRWKLTHLFNSLN